mmetsp:Transcript_29842/g.84110  ORF Transcript_29842/g.84110 Transcript_29842/m.84110 type:complete len:381 (-) Transcript_29842:325-1467(-)
MEVDCEAPFIPPEHEAGIVPRPKRPRLQSSTRTAERGQSAVFANSPLPGTGLPLKLWGARARSRHKNYHREAGLTDQEEQPCLAPQPVASTSCAAAGSSESAATGGGAGEPQAGRGRHPLDLTNPVLLTCVLSRLDAESLCRMGATSKAFCQLTEPSAKAALDQRPDTQFLQETWRGESWKKLLHLSESFCGFDMARCEPEGFSFTHDKNQPQHVSSVILNGMGPKLLLSEKSTLDQPLLYWRLSVEGNTAIEFGVVAETRLQPGDDFNVQLHKAKRCGEPGMQADGFASKHTHGSELSMRVPVFRGSVVDILASKGAVTYRVSHPDHAKELVQRGGYSVMQGYSGPKEFRFSHSLQVESELRLACTLWSRGKLTNLQPV